MKINQNIKFTSPVTSIGLSPDETLVSVVGSHIFQIFTIDDNGQFQDYTNLKSKKGHPFDYSANNVEFCPVDNTVLVSGSTTGSLIFWNIARSGSVPKQSRYKIHERSINKVNFNKENPNLVLSGSQDGMIKIFDCRKNETVQTFNSVSEGVRDVQFNPHSPHCFAAVTEGCSVQVCTSAR